jgi:di/tricarboxylate transporter
MPNMADPDVLQPTIRTCQIIVGAMIMGVLSFLAIILFVTTVVLNPPPALPGAGAGGPAIAGPGNSPLPVITYLAVAVGFVNLALSFVIPRMNADRTRRQIALEGPTAVTKGGPSEAKQVYPASYSAKLAQNYQTQLIIGAALLEGGAFFAAIAYMLERSPLALATAIVLLATLAALFPTSDRVNAWLDRQLELLQEERHSAS